MTITVIRSVSHCCVEWQSPLHEVTDTVMWSDSHCCLEWQSLLSGVTVTVVWSDSHCCMEWQSLLNWWIVCFLVFNNINASQVVNIKCWALLCVLISCVACSYTVKRVNSPSDYNLVSTWTHLLYLASTASPCESLYITLSRVEITPNMTLVFIRMNRFYGNGNLYKGTWVGKIIAGAEVDARVVQYIGLLVFLACL